jgi:D-psicose/D-tagatose/L-ribulose 3-epimerase
VSNNSVGIHYQVFTSVWDGAEMGRTARRAADAGFDFLELTCIDADDFDVNGTQAALSAAGIGTVLSTAMLPENDVASPDRVISALGEEHLMRTLDVASELEAPWLVGLTHSAWAKASEAPTVAGRANSVDALRRVTARAEELGVSMGLEVVNRFENNFLNTAAQARALIDDVGSSTATTPIWRRRAKPKRLRPAETASATSISAKAIVVASAQAASTLQRTPGQ